MSTVTESIVNEVKKAISGKDHIIAQTLTAILAGGHILMEDVPGVGKTTMALAFSRTMGLDYGRVQFTPDVLPSDITGFSLYDKRTETMKYQPGSIFHNLFLADELNRASSRTQSALLEAMEESKVTVDGSTYLLPNPFIVIATQNPAGSSGTSLLPDSQVDRFMIRVSMGYPSASAEKALIDARKNGVNPLDSVKPVCDTRMILQMQNDVNNIFIHEKIIDYIVMLVNKTRLSLTSMAKAYAYLSGRNYVIPSDIQKVFLPVIAHRLILTPEAEVNGKNPVEIAQEIIKAVPTPKV